LRPSCCRVPHHHQPPARQPCHHHHPQPLHHCCCRSLPRALETARWQEAGNVAQSVKQRPGCGVGQQRCLLVICVEALTTHHLLLWRGSCHRRLLVHVCFIKLPTTSSEHSQQCARPRCNTVTSACGRA
jgi:hypothetical protein